LLIYYYFIYFIKCIKIERDMQQKDYTKIWVKDSLSFRHHCISAFDNRKSSLPLMAWSVGYWLCCHVAPRTRQSMRIGFFEIMRRNPSIRSKTLRMTSIISLTRTYSHIYFDHFILYHSYVICALFLQWQPYFFEIFSRILKFCFVLEEKDFII